jgi:hypothetical protein
MSSLFKTPKAPKPLDVGATTALANTQNTQNAYQNAAFNRLNQTDALGNSLQYSQSGTDAQGNPIFNATQRLGETGQRFAGGFSDLGQKYFDQANNRPDLGSDAAFDRAYGYASANLEPRFQRTQDQTINRLRNQGLDPTSEAYKSQMNDLALQQNEARNNLVTGLQGQMFAQGLQNRQQQMGELQPGLDFGRGTIQPNLVNTPGVGVQNVDVAGLAGINQQNQYQNYNAQMQQQNAMLGGLAGIGGSLIGAPWMGSALGFGAAGGMMGKGGR